MVAPTRPQIDGILGRLAANGGRRTAARQAIVEAVFASGSHLTADEIARRVQKRFPSVNISTVYRTLESLEKLGVIDHVHLGHGRAIYHRSDDAHQHLVCERCERVEELPASKLRNFLGMLEREFGFEVDRGHFAIVGLCKACRTR
ncbi:MAG TPA: transcriptional repressor [Actinomycetota bacterium]|jgi:Fe2+ or Zn2+ uptake regulation protein|nr:transcriptional repressor [Actinomycetota bacterium]